MALMSVRSLPVQVSILLKGTAVVSRVCWSRTDEFGPIQKLNGYDVDVESGPCRVHRTITVKKGPCFISGSGGPRNRNVSPARQISSRPCIFLSLMKFEREVVMLSEDLPGDPRIEQTSPLVFYSDSTFVIALYGLLGSSTCFLRQAVEIDSNVFHSSHMAQQQVMIRDFSCCYRYCTNTEKQRKAVLHGPLLDLPAFAR